MWGGIPTAQPDSLPSAKPVVVGADVDRWGQPIRPAGDGWVKVSAKDTGGPWARFETPVLPATGVPLHVTITRKNGSTFSPESL
jgi:hypothetical protein